MIGVGCYILYQLYNQEDSEEIETDVQHTDIVTEETTQEDDDIDYEVLSKAEEEVRGKQGGKAELIIGIIFFIVLFAIITIVATTV